MYLHNVLILWPDGRIDEFGCGVVWFGLTVADSMKEATRPPCVAVLRRGKDTCARGKFPCPCGWLWCGTGALRENLHQTGISGSHGLTLCLLHLFFFSHWVQLYIQLPKWLSGKESSRQCRRIGFDPWFGKLLWRRRWQPTPVFWPGESHGQRSLVGYSP